ncbi:MAG TPA: crosslink repair DNA glycosylase YcaQ family protein [Pseudobdellovibrionaceae bacterium]|nr:crosslink repair DNA glycosylase YcaQ family protein [Pseudobdellovibrionaceae bacterium]
MNVIERCHHHILFTRIPSYKRSDPRLAQSRDKTVFEHWTHALAYVPTEDLRYFLPRMKASSKDPCAPRPSSAWTPSATCDPA